MTTHRHFPSITALLATLREESGPPPPLAYGAEFEWATDGDKLVAFPSPAAPYSSRFLYRGQTARHRPCVASIYRIGRRLARHPQALSIKQRARHFASRVRLLEFSGALASHPASAFAESIGLRVSDVALAQHYGISTDHIDLSQDPSVAAFFATHAPSSKGAWAPVESRGKRHLGVIYRVEGGAFREWARRKFGAECLDVIGKQALPRPGEQRAWSMHLPLGIELESCPVDVMTFEHSPPHAAMLGAAFEGGARLFPPDVMADVAGDIRKAPDLPRALVLEALRQICPPGEVFDREASAAGPYLRRELGLAVVDRPPRVLTQAEHDRATAETEARRTEFLGSVGWRLVRNARVDPA